MSRHLFVMVAAVSMSRGRSEKVIMLDRAKRVPPWVIAERCAVTRCGGAAGAFIRAARARRPAGILRGDREPRRRTAEARPVPEIYIRALPMPDPPDLLQVEA